MKECALCESTSAGTAVRFSRSRPICDWCADSLDRRGMRYCARCGTVKKLTHFSITCKQWRRRICKTCSRKSPAYKQSQQLWQKNNREKINAYGRANYHANKALHQARNRAHYQRRRAHYLARFAVYRSSPEWQVRRRAWLAENHARLAAQQRMRRVRMKLAILRGER